MTSTTSIINTTQIRLLDIEDMAQPDIQTQMETLEFISAISNTDITYITPTKQTKPTKPTKPTKKRKLTSTKKEAPVTKYVWTTSGTPQESIKHHKKTKEFKQTSLNIKTLIKNQVLEMNLPTKYKPYKYRDCISENLCGHFLCVVDKKPFQVYLFQLVFFVSKV